MGPIESISSSSGMTPGSCSWRGSTLLVARLDTLGKGASGAAVQNLNIVTGANELSGLVL